MTSTSSLTRRALLQSAPLGMAALATLAPDAIAAPDVGNEPNELMALFRAWDACDGAAWEVETDAQSDAICERMRQLETAMMAIPATTAGEFAAKLIVYTGYGDWLPSRQIIAEAARVCGASRADVLTEATTERDL